MTTAELRIADTLAEWQGKVTYAKLAEKITQELKESGFIIMTASDIAKTISQSMPYA